MQAITVHLLRLLICFPFVLCAISDEPHHTSAFIPSAGETQSLISYSHYSTDHFWDNHGTKLSAFGRFQRYSYLLYAEHSINQRHSLTLNGGYSHVNETLNGVNRGVEDLEISWKWVLYKTVKSNWTSQLTAIIPTGGPKASIRYGRSGIQLELLYSSKFFFLSRQGLYDTGIGYRYYTGFPSDQFRAFFAAKYPIFSYSQLILTSLLEYGLRPQEETLYSNYMVLNPFYRLFKAKIEFLFTLSHQTRITLGGFWSIWGENVGTGGGFFGGAWIDF